MQNISAVQSGVRKIRTLSVEVGLGAVPRVITPLPNPLLPEAAIALPGANVASRTGAEMVSLPWSVLLL